MRTPIMTVSGKGLPHDAEHYVRTLIRFYDRRASWHRRMHRLSGGLVIVIGAVMPLLVSASFPGKETATAGAGAAVAVLAALRGFYHWDSSWALLRRTEMQISRAYLSWRARRPAASADDAAGIAALLETVDDIRVAEANEFFRGITDTTTALQQPGTPAAPPPAAGSPTTALPDPRTGGQDPVAAATGGP